VTLRVAAVAGGLCAAAMADAAPAARARVVRIEAPKGAVALTVSSAEGRLAYEVTLRGRAVIEPSALGLLLDGADLGQGALIERVERGQTAESYPWYGAHAQVTVRARSATLTLRHTQTATPYALEVRAFDDAVAFRFRIAGAPGQRRVPDAATTFRLPSGSVVWSHGLRDHYEGLYQRQAVEELTSGQWAGPPVTVALPGGRGYAAITEAGLDGYAGMVLQADGQRGFSERLGHAAPASYPFTLRYGESEAVRLAAPAAVEGPITGPWRVVMVGPDLNTLVNCDAVSALAPPPDPQLFPQGLRTPWIRPGRAVWRYLDGGENTLEGMKEFSRLAAELGFEHHVVEGFWQRWSEADLRELVAYSSTRRVSLWLWKHSRDLRERAERRALFARLSALGIAGLKVRASAAWSIGARRPGPRTTPPGRSRGCWRGPPTSRPSTSASAARRRAGRTRSRARPSCTLRSWSTARTRGACSTTRRWRSSRACPAPGTRRACWPRAPSARWRCSPAAAATSGSWP
jgi:alpha-glucosidase